MALKIRASYFILLFAIFATSCAHVDKSVVQEITFANSPGFWTPDFKINKETLSNGLTVLYVEDHSVPIVSYTTWFKVGSSYEKKGATGIAHLFEHMMFKGTANFPGKAFFNRLESRGAIVNAYTERDATVYYATLAPRYLELLIEMEADRMTNLNITQEGLDSERKVVQEERRLRVESNYLAQAMEEFNEVAFPGHPYGWPTVGYMTDLESLSVQQCKQFYEKYYQPKNAIIVVAGDFNLDETKSWIRKYYGKLKSVEVEKIELPEVAKKFKKPKFSYVKPVKNETIVIGYRIPSMFDNDAEAISMLAWTYFGMNSSLANVKLIRENKTALGVSADAELERFPYLFLIAVDVKPGISSDRVLSQLDLVIDQAKNHNLTEAEIERVKNKLEYSVINEAKTPQGFASWLASGEFYWNDPKHIFQVVEKYQKMTAKDIQRVARKYLKNENRQIMILKDNHK